MQKVIRKKRAPQKTVVVGSARVPVKSMRTVRGAIRAYLRGHEEAFRKLGD